MAEKINWSKKEKTDFRDLWHKKKCRTFVIRPLERKDSVYHPELDSAGKIFEIMAENFLTWQINLQKAIRGYKKLQKRQIPKYPHLNTS